MKKVVVAALYPIFQERIGGMDRFFWEFHRKASSLGYELIWIFPESNDFIHYRNQGIIPIFLPQNDFDKHLVSWIYQHHGIDILITHFIAYNTKYARQWKSNVGKLICVDHMSRPYITRGIHYWFKYLLKGLVNYFYIDKIVAVSPFVKRSILGELGFWWNFKTDSVYNGVDQKVYQFDSSILKDNFIFSIGHMIADKGFQDLVLAVEFLKTFDFTVKVILAGDGPFLPDLKKMITKKGLEEQFQLLGDITNQSYYYNAAICTVVPSKWKEACGFTVLEALSCGSYVIGSDVGAIPEILGYGVGTIYPNGDFRKLAEFIKLKVANNTLEHKDSLFLINYASKHFNLNNMVEKHIAISCSK